MRRAVALGFAAVLVLALAGCGDQTRHLRDICDDVTDGTADLARYDPAHPVTALQFALGRFDLVEEGVSKARATSLPAGAASTLRRDWLEPAVTSLAAWDTRLDAVRQAVRADDRTQVDATLGPALALGTDGVNTAALDRAGFDACARAFTAPTTADATV